VSSSIIPTTTLSSNSRSLYTPQQCDSWISTALAIADANASSNSNNNNGLSQTEYLTFLQSISPPYVGQYFASFPSFAELPYDARISNKILSCSCSSLPGYDKDTCCSGLDNAELPLAGFRSGDTTASSDNTNTTASTMNDNGENDVVAISKEELAYRTYFCEILGNLVSRVPVVPTTRPTSSSPSLTSSSSTPSQLPSKLPFQATVDVNPSINEAVGGLSTGAMIGIILAILVAILVAILMRQLRNKVEATGEDEENNHEEVEGAAADRKDDASSDPSVWSESEERNKSMNDDDNKNYDDDVEEQRVEGSAVAAIGVASTVVTQVSSPKRNNDVV